MINFIFSCFMWFFFLNIQTSKPSETSFHGVSRPSGLLRQTCILMAESSECGFESWPWCLRPWAIKTLCHNCFSPPRSKWVPDEYSVGCCVWLGLCVIELCYSPGSWDGFRNDLWVWWAGVIKALWAPVWWIRGCAILGHVIVIIIIIIHLVLLNIKCTFNIFLSAGRFDLNHTDMKLFVELKLTRNLKTDE